MNVCVCVSVACVFAREKETERETNIGECEYSCLKVCGRKVDEQPEVHKGKNPVYISEHAYTKC